MTFCVWCNRRPALREAAYCAKCELDRAAFHRRLSVVVTVCLVALVLFLVVFL